VEKQFRCAFATNNYDATIDFYKNGLGFTIVESWNRSDDDKGTLFKAASGIIEVVKRSVTQDDHGDWENDTPSGFTIVIELEDVDDYFRDVSSKGVSISEGLNDQKWGHRSFRVVDPNRVNLYFFTETARTKK